MLTTDAAVDFREAMGSLATGVVVVTTHLEGRPWGMTVSACCSVSLSPPSLLVSLASTTSSARAIGASGRFGVSILSADAIEVARFGAARGMPKFLNASQCSSQASSLSPVIAGALAHVDCELADSLVVGDHEVFVGEVRDVTLDPGDEPLVYFARSFRTLASTMPADLLYANW